MAQRWAVVRLLDQGIHYAEISRETGASTATITRIASWLNHGEGGYREASTPRRRAARPHPLPRPATDEGAPPPGRPEQGPAGRADAAPAPRRRPRLRGARPEPRRPRPELRPGHPVRAHERRHRVRRRRRRRPRHHRHRPADRDRRELPRVRELGYGRCRLAAAVPTDAPYQTVEDLAGLRVATAHPNTARRFFAERGIAVDIIPISGAVEVAPRLGLAEGDRRPRLDRLDAGHERPAPDRRRPRRPRPSSSPTRPRSASAPPSSPRSTRCSARSSPPAAAST